MPLITYRQYIIYPDISASLFIRWQTTNPIAVVGDESSFQLFGIFTDMSGNVAGSFWSWFSLLMPLQEKKNSCSGRNLHVLEVCRFSGIPSIVYQFLLSFEILLLRLWGTISLYWWGNTPITWMKVKGTPWKIRTYVKFTDKKEWKRKQELIRLRNSNSGCFILNCINIQAESLI